MPLLVGNMGALQAGGAVSTRDHDQERCCRRDCWFQDGQFLGILNACFAATVDAMLHPPAAAASVLQW